MSTSQPAVDECCCIIRHAITTKERAEVTTALAYARCIGDTTGILIALVRLTGHCPARANQ